jgi:hypothetical protein
MTPFETIAAIIDAAGPAERPQEVAVPPPRASAPKDKTGGRRQAAAPSDLATYPASGLPPASPIPPAASAAAVEGIVSNIWRGHTGTATSRPG